jgi:hypothetical protein
MAGMTRSGRVLAGVLLVLGAGCQGPGGGQSHGPALVPWSAVVPPALREQAISPAARCRSSQLRAGTGFVFQPAAAGGGTGTVTLRNAGRSPCRLDGRPAVRFVGAPRAPGQRQQAQPAGEPGFPHVLPPAATLLALAPGAAATLTVEWRNWCVPGAASGTPLVPPRAVRVTLPGAGGSLEVGYDAVTSCENPAEPSTIGVRPFQPAPLAEPGSWTGARVQATILALDGQAPPLHGRRGETVGFAVELRNQSRTAARYDRCPIIAELLAPAGSTEVYQLNCAAAGPVPPSTELRFEARLRVPADAPLGSNGLFWVLDATGTQPLQVVSRLTVDG